MWPRNLKLNVYASLLIYLILVVVVLAALGPPLWRVIYPWPYRETIERYAERYDVDPHLVAAMIFVESRFRPHVTSAPGARGLMQIMPNTGQWIAGQLAVDDFHLDQLFDPEINIRFGVWYLSHLQAELPGDLAVHLAAYNAGRGNVALWMAQGRWDGTAEDAERIPFAETRRYVQRVLRLWTVYRELH